MPAVMIVRPSVWFTLMLTILSSGSRRIEPEVLAHAIEDDDRVVHRVPGDRQDRRNDVQRQLVPEERQHREHDEDVVERRDERADGEDQPEPKRDVDADAHDRGDRRENALPLEVAPDNRSDDLRAEDVELADPGLLDGGNRLPRAGLETEPLLLAVRLREPDEDLVLRRIAVLLHDLLAGQDVERAAHRRIADRLVEAQDHDRAAREIDPERQAIAERAPAPARR